MLPGFGNTSPWRKDPRRFVEPLCACLYSRILWVGGSAYQVTAWECSVSGAAFRLPAGSVRLELNEADDDIGYDRRLGFWDFGPEERAAAEEMWLRIVEDPLAAVLEYIF